MEKSVEKDLLTDILESFVIAMAFSIVIFFTIIAPNQVDGESMEPTFHNEDKLITNKVSQWLGSTEVGKSMGLEYDRGDIVVFSLGDRDLVKRVIAKGGDKIKIQNGSVYVNGNLLQEKYLTEGLLTRTFIGPFSFISEGQELTVPNDHFFVMGDNRGNSKDSRFSEVGFVSRDQVRGRVAFKYWPLSEIHAVTKGDFVEVAPTN